MSSDKEDMVKIHIIDNTFVWQITIWRFTAWPGPDAHKHINKTPKFACDLSPPVNQSESISKNAQAKTTRSSQEMVILPFQDFSQSGPRIDRHKTEPSSTVKPCHSWTSHHLSEVTSSPTCLEAEMFPGLCSSCGETLCGFRSSPRCISCLLLKQWYLAAGMRRGIVSCHNIFLEPDWLFLNRVGTNCQSTPAEITVSKLRASVCGFLVFLLHVILRHVCFNSRACATARQMNQNKTLCLEEHRCAESQTPFGFKDSASREISLVETTKSRWGFTGHAGGRTEDISHAIFKAKWRNNALQNIREKALHDFWLNAGSCSSPAWFGCLSNCLYF